MMNRLLSITALLFICGNTHAFGGDGAIIAQLQMQTAKMVEQLKTVSEALDVNKRLEEMESLKFVKQISEEGQALRGIVSDVNEATSIIDDQANNPFGHDDITNEIDRLSERLGNAENAKDYANIMSDLKRLKILGNANRNAMKNAAQGTDEQEDIKSTSTSTMIMADILIDQEKRRTIMKAEEQSAIQSLMGSNGYAELYGEK